jgi:hypothetical protein
VTRVMGSLRGVVMPNWEQYRARALECLELARLTRDPETKSSLMSMAQGWLRMAYSRHVDHFEHLVDDFNQRQMTERPPGIIARPLSSAERWRRFAR